MQISELEKNDPVLTYIKEYFEVGRKFSYEEILKITLEGKHRYEFKIPPGYADHESKEKMGFQIFGDLIIWKQLLEYAREVNKNVVFICNDLKEDWCIKEESTNKRIKSPRSELIKEFVDFAGTAFWMYNHEQFLFKAEKLLSTSISNEQIEPVKELLSERIDKRLVMNVSFNAAWRLNHWGSNCANINEDKMLFKGLIAPHGTDGSHIDLFNILEPGSRYIVTCMAKSTQNTTGEFQLWCHDKIGEPNGVSSSSQYKTPPLEGERVSIEFDALFNENIRLHLQYKPGEGQIEVSEIKIHKIES